MTRIRYSNKVKNLVLSYFRMGMHQSEIVVSLAAIDNIFVSERHLRRILKDMGLRRKGRYSDLLIVARFLEQEIERCGQLCGYRWMHLRCIQNGFTVTQEMERHLLKILDPNGVKIRKRRRLRRRKYRNKGPNYLWHMDCYDKLKPYGICISGCIDGFSRHIIWLEAGRNTNNPKIIAGYFVRTVESIGGCPLRVRADMGTKNRHVEQMQVFLRQAPTIHDISNSLPPFFYGTSQANQRIESWWGILRQHKSQFWMNLFQQLKDDNLFNGTLIDKALVQYCFLPTIKVSFSYARLHKC